MSGYRPPYTIEEEKKILNFIIENQYYYRLRGELMWRELQDTNLVERTWQSLHQHFRKKLINKIAYPVYEIPKEEQEKIRVGYHTMAKGNKEKERGETKEKDSSAASTSLKASQRKKEVDFHTLDSDGD